MNKIMQDFIDKPERSRNGYKSFFPVTLNPARAGLLCSSEHGKLCFEHPETIRDAQNNLPRQQAESKNALRSRGFV